MKACIFCGAKKSSPYALEFRCETTGINHLSQITWNRSDYCYRQQLAQQANLLRQALNFAIVVKNYPLHHEGELVYSIDDINNEAQSLISDIGKALEKVK